LEQARFRQLRDGRKDAAHSETKRRFIAYIDIIRGETGGRMFKHIPK